MLIKTMKFKNIGVRIFCWICVLAPSGVRMWTFVDTVGYLSVPGPRKSGQNFELESYLVPIVDVSQARQD